MSEEPDTYRASVELPEELADEVDVVVIRSDEYENRSEWIVDAMREKLNR